MTEHASGPALMLVAGLGSTQAASMHCCPSAHSASDAQPAGSTGSSSEAPPQPDRAAASDSAASSGSGASDSADRCARSRHEPEATGAPMPSRPAPEGGPRRDGGCGESICILRWLHWPCRPTIEVRSAGLRPRSSMALPPDDSSSRAAEAAGRGGGVRPAPERRGRGSARKRRERPRRAPASRAADGPTAPDEEGALARPRREPGAAPIVGPPRSRPRRSETPRAERLPSGSGASEAARRRPHAATLASSFASMSAAPEGRADAGSGAPEQTSASVSSSNAARSSWESRSAERTRSRP